MPLFNLLKTVPQIRRNVSMRLVNKEENQRISRQFGQAYFDGPREQGYGGYTYDGRWVAVAETVRDRYKLTAGQKVLDVGCAKGFLVHDLRQVVPGLDAYGLDISQYALEHAKAEVADCLTPGNAKSLPWPDNHFDAVLAINTLHNLHRADCIQALREMTRVCKNPERCFVQVDAYRTPEEKALFEAWVLTADTWCMPHEWEALFAEADYRGDYFWTILEPETTDS